MEDFMASIERVRKNEAQEISDLQSEYADKKRRFVKKQEEEIAGLEEFYDDKKNKTIKQNEAAISHLRERQDAMNEDSTGKYRALAKKHNERLTKLNDEFQSSYQETVSKRQDELERSRDYAHKRVKEVQDDGQKKIENFREQSQQELEYMKERHKKDLSSFTKYSDKQKNQIRGEHEEVIRREVDRAKYQQEKLHDRFDKEFESTKKRGEERVQAVIKKGEEDVIRTKVANQKQHEKQVKQWQQREAQINEEFANKIEHTKGKQGEELHNLHDRFTSLYQKSQNNNENSLRVQRELFAKQLNATKHDFVRDAGKYEDRESDPFYRLEDRNSQMHETSNFYIIKAFVPEHEKENVKVSVQKDKVTISGQRSFQDKIEDEDTGKKISSSSFQSFREEFPFTEPVITQGMTRERDGDWVVFEIPKLSAYAGKLSRKA